MKLVRCPKGHFYDEESYSVCPYCNGADSVAPVTQPIRTGDDIPTSKKESMPSHDAGKAGEAKLSDVKESSALDDQRTVAKYKKDLGADPVVGWLVCIRGKHFGEDFKLKGGKNFVGRDATMDVCLSKDSSVSRRRHVVILYDPKSNEFLVLPGESRELAYLNDSVIIETKLLHSGDIITVGSTDLMFIPFCSEKFRWEKKSEEQE